MAKDLMQRTAAAAAATPQEAAKRTVNDLISSVLDGQKMRKRFDELLGARAPQFISTLTTMINGDENLMQAFYESPVTVVQAALKAASYDLPIDPSLGYAYIVPFKKQGRMTVSFVPGWRGYHQLALRTAMYKTINVVDVREGELVRYNRLTEEAEIEFIEDEERREQLPVVGYIGYYKLINGFEKTIYRTIAQLDAHEKKHRKGQDKGYGWKKWPDAMYRKTVYRELIAKWGIMSIDYRSQAYADLSDVAAADDQADGDGIDWSAAAQTAEEIPFVEVDDDGEVLPEG